MWAYLPAPPTNLSPTDSLLKGASSLLIFLEPLTLILHMQVIYSTSEC